jgi:hypothetical protein
MRQYFSRGIRSIKDNMGEAIFPLIVIICTSLYVYDVYDIRQPSLNLLLVRPTIVIIFLLAIILIWTQVFKLKVKVKKETEENSKKEEKNVQITWRPFIYTLVFLIYLVFLPLFGFLITTVLFVLSILFLMSERNWKKLLIISIIVSGVVYLVFTILLGVPLP